MVISIKSEAVKILLVDDNDANLMVAGLWLDEFGHSYEKAHDGAEAVEKFKTNEFPIILMDVEMHEMNGYQATILIREFEKANDLKPSFIIALTANAQLDDRDKCIQCGMDDYISKPINFKELNKKLNLLKGKAA